MFICITVSTRHNLTPKQSVKADPCSGLGLHFKKKMHLISGLIRVCYGFTRGRFLGLALCTKAD